MEGDSDAGTQGPFAPDSSVPSGWALSIVAPPAPADRPSPGPARLVVASIIAVAGVCALTVVVFMFGLAGILSGFADRTGALNWLFAVFGIMVAVIAFATVAVLLVVTGLSVRELLGTWRIREIVAGAAIWSLVLGAWLLAARLRMPELFYERDLASVLGGAIFLTPVIAVLVLAEEFVFRGLITRSAFAVTKSLPIACVFAGVTYGASAFPVAYFFGPTDVSRLGVSAFSWPLMATLFGMALSLAALRTGGLGLGFGIHVVNNVFVICVLMQLSRGNLLNAEYYSLDLASGARYAALFVVVLVLSKPHSTVRAPTTNARRGLS